jgi:putative DNA primase/helicase
MVTTITNDAELSLELADIHREDLAWTDGTGWLHYTEANKRWVAIPEEVVIKIISDDLRGQFKIWAAQLDDKDAIRKLLILLSTGKAKSVLALIAGRLRRLDAEFDAHPDLLNTQSGVVDLRTGALTPHDATLLFTKITRVAYKPGTSNPLWVEALEAVPEVVRAWLQQRLGQSAFGRIAPKGLLIVFRGGGSNGKTTILGGCFDALGDYAILVPDKVLLGNANDHSTELTTLKGARFAMIEETAQAKKLDVTRLKKLVETPQMTARRIRENSMTWDSTHTIFLSSNFRPIITETDHGTWRRLALVEFPFTFEESDFRDRTKAEDVLEAILAWLVEGAVAFHREPLPIPDVVQVDTAKWREETDLVMSFIRARIEFDIDSSVLAGDMLDEFNAFISAGSHYAWTDRTFVQQFEPHDLLKGHAVTHKRTRDTSHLSRPFKKQGAPVPAQPWVWTGVKLRDNTDAEIYAASLDWAYLVSMAHRADGEL